MANLDLSNRPRINDHNASKAKLPHKSALELCWRVFQQNHCTAAINAVAWTLSNYRITIFNPQAKGFYKRKFGFFAKSLGTPGLEGILNKLNITLIVEYFH
jgi:hypothetical protein